MGRIKKIFQGTRHGGRASGSPNVRQWADNGQPAPWYLMANRRGRSGHSYKKGHLAETVAVWFLRLRGYRILARRYKTTAGEVDIIAVRGRMLLAVEVKYRKHGEPLEAVSTQQQGRILRAMELFLAGNPRFSGYTVRCDVMAMAPWRWPRHIRQAWEG